MRKAWRFFVYLLWLVANGSDSELVDFFAQPQQCRPNYRQTALLYTDQIPVWLKVEAGKTLVSEGKLAALRAGQHKRRARRAGAKRLAAKVAARAAGMEAEEAAKLQDLPEEEPDQDSG